MASLVVVGQRCQLENGARGEVRFVGKVAELGFGYFVGVLLDEPQVGLGTGTLDGNYYFYSPVGQGYF